MDRDEKAAVAEQIAGQIEQSEAIFAVDYRGINVPQIAELRMKLRDADASFRVVKNTLTQRAADKAGKEQLKQYLDGPTAFAFINGDIAIAAKALNDYAKKDVEAIRFKGGLMQGEPVTAEQILEIARLPARAQLNAQLAGMVASPLTTLVRGLGSMVQGLAVALGQLQEKRAAEEPAPEPEAAEEEVESADDGEEPSEEDDRAAVEDEQKTDEDDKAVEEDEEKEEEQNGN